MPALQKSRSYLRSALRDMCLLLGEVMGLNIVRLTEGLTRYLRRAPASGYAAP